MKRTSGSDANPSAVKSFGVHFSEVAQPIVRLVGDLRSRLKPATYVDWSDTPLEPESPYRARLTMPAEQLPDGVELGQRDVVRGEITAIYEVRCACGKRWFNPQFENVQLCPRCGCAVLLSRPDSLSS
jgi:hypothetical protein